MYYILISDDKVQEIIPEENPDFPGVPVSERYAPDFLARCVLVDDDIVVSNGMLYDREAGTFSEPPPNEPEVKLL